MDRLNHLKFEINDTTAQYYTLSNGLLTQDKDLFSVPHNDIWCILYMNLDPKREDLYVAVSTKIILNPIIFYIYPSLVMLIIISLSIVIWTRNKILKKKNTILGPLILSLLIYFYYIANILLN